MQLFDGVSYKLARSGVILAFTLGMAMSTLQVYQDYHSQAEELDKMVKRIMDVASRPASRAVHTLDKDLANEVVSGLLDYDFIFGATIMDELGEILAEEIKPYSKSRTKWITAWITSEFKHFSVPIQIPMSSQVGNGRLLLVVDNDRALVSFFERAKLLLIAGLIRNLILVLLLFGAFHYLITRPLIQISQDLRAIDPNSPKQRRLAVSNGHQRDELGQLAASGNEFISTVEELLEQRREVEQALAESESQMRLIIDMVPHLIYAKDTDDCFAFANRAVAQAYGQPELDLKGVRHETLHSQLPNPGNYELLQSDGTIIATGMEKILPEVRFWNAEGSETYLQTHKIPFRYHGETMMLCVAVDVTDRKLAEEQIEHLAFHDPLTNLPNRNQLISRFKEEIERAKRLQQIGALLFIDLDHFKNINDSLGHPVGDEVLIQLANRLRENVRSIDTVSRLGGDEFVVVLSALAPTQPEAALKARDIAEKLRKQLTQPFHYINRELHITASIGIVLYPDGNRVVHDFLQFADTAMYQAKSDGRDTIEFFEESMADVVNRQLTIENHLRKALPENQFVLHYQPQVSLETGLIIGAEVLIRWQHPQWGLVSPVEFIPVMEGSGLVHSVGHWIIETACQQLRGWLEQALWPADARLAVNLSPKQFNSSDFCSTVEKILDQTGVPTKNLELEITESAVMRDVDQTVDKMLQLTELGISFSLDDFGTGYSSLSYLKRLPVETVKIDRSFVRDINVDHDDAAIVETILAMARHLNLEVVAEGVENQLQLDFLAQNQCDYYQGFFFSKPVSADKFEQLLQQQQQPHDANSTG